MFVYHVYAHTMYMYQFSSVAQSCLTLCDPMNLNTPGLPVHHQLPEFTQTHIHGISDAIQPSHPLSSPSLPAPNPSQHQSLFQWVQCICINTHIMANGGGSLEIIFIWHQISSLVMGRSLDIWSLYVLEFSREIELIGDVCSCLSLSIIFISIYLSIWRRQWQPTPVLLPGKSHGRRSLVGCSPWGHEESDIYWATSLSLSCIGEGNGSPLQCSCLENPRDGGAWWAAICGVAQSRTWLKRLSSSSIYLSREICLKELAHMFMKTGKSKICRANVPIWVQRPEAAIEPKRAQVLFQRSSDTSSNSPLWMKEVQLFVLFRPSSNWMRFTYIMKSSLFYSVYRFKSHSATSSQKHPE